MYFEKIYAYLNYYLFELKSEVDSLSNYMYYDKYYVNLNYYLVIKFENCLDQLSSIERIINKKNGWLN